MLGSHKGILIMLSVKLVLYSNKEWHILDQFSILKRKCPFNWHNVFPSFSGCTDLTVFSSVKGWSTLTAPPWPTPLPGVKCLGDLVQGTGWGKVLPKRERKAAPACPASCITPPQGCQRHTGSWWTDRAAVNTSSHHQMEMLQLGVQPCARTLCDASSWGASPAQVAPAASPLRGFPRHTACCKQLLIIKS